MMRARAILVGCMTAWVSHHVLAQDARIIQADGTVVETDVSRLAEPGRDAPSGWRALWIGPTPTQAQDGGSAMCLQDGQVIVGGFEPSGQELWWRNPRIGASRVDLERVARIGPRVVNATRPSARDVVHFVNGDRAEGFIQAIDVTHGVRLAPITAEGAPAADVVDHDLERVVAVWLAARPESATGWRFWFRDGSVIDADQWTLQGEQIVLTGPHLAGAPRQVLVDRSQVIAIRRDPTSVVALASLPWRSSDVPNSPRLSPARARPDPGVHALDLSPIDLHGPGVFEASIPPGEWLLDASLVAPPGLSGSLGCVVVILDGEREVLRFPITGSSERMPLRAMFRSGRVVVRIDDSERGAWGAAVRMDRPFLVPINPVAAESSPSTSTGTSPPGSPSR
jgi:hypothetical protein